MYAECKIPNEATNATKDVRALHQNRQRKAFLIKNINLNTTTR